MQTQQEHTATPRLGRYEIDTGASAITFRIRTRHMFGLMPVSGSFTIRGGTIDVTEPVTGSSVRVELETASFRTNHWQRDHAVRSAQFLDADRHPVITFVSTRVEGTTLSGMLTVGGITRPVSLSVERTEVSPEAFTARAITRVDRTEFGVTAAPGLIARHIDLTLEVTCVLL